MNLAVQCRRVSAGDTNLRHSSLMCISWANKAYPCPIMGTGTYIFLGKDGDFDILTLFEYLVCAYIVCIFVF